MFEHHAIWRKSFDQIVMFGIWSSVNGCESLNGSGRGISKIECSKFCCYKRFWAVMKKSFHIKSHKIWNKQQGFSFQAAGFLHAYQHFHQIFESPWIFGSLTSSSTNIVCVSGHQKYIFCICGPYQHPKFNFGFENGIEQHRSKKYFCRNFEISFGYSTCTSARTNFFPFLRWFSKKFVFQPFGRLVIC